MFVRTLLTFCELGLLVLPYPTLPWVTQVSGKRFTRVSHALSRYPTLPQPTIQTCLYDWVLVHWFQSHMVLDILDILDMLDILDILATELMTCHVTPPFGVCETPSACAAASNITGRPCHA